jgi:hypothetical protein
MLADGSGLYLRTTPGSKGWVFRYQIAGQRHDMGLGSIKDVSLTAAREKIRSGIDPITDHRARLGALRVAAAKAKTFNECAEAYIAAHRAAWKNQKHRQQWDNTLATSSLVRPKLSRQDGSESCGRRGNAGSEA